MSREIANKYLSMWGDKYKLIHTSRQDVSIPIDSENPILFTSVFHRAFLLAYGHKDKESAVTAISILRNETIGEWRDTPSHGWHGNKFGLDNFKAMLCLSKMYGLDYHSKISIWDRHGGRRFWNDVPFYGWVKYSALYEENKLYLPLKLIFTLLLPLVSLAMIVSCKQTYKNKPYWWQKKFWTSKERFKIVKTDGKIIAWLCCKTFNMNKTFNKCEKAINKNTEFFGSWPAVFDRYYPEGHPNRELIRKIFKEK